jgi:hypothetical protein
MRKLNRGKSSQKCGLQGQLKRKFPMGENNSPNLVTLFCQSP